MEQQVAWVPAMGEHVFVPNVGRVGDIVATGVRDGVTLFVVEFEPVIRDQEDGDSPMFEWLVNQTLEACELEPAR
jgi:hypothetical protein